MNIIRKKSTWKQWRRIGNSISPQRGSAISQVVVPDDSGDTLYATIDGVETQVSTAIAKRYKTGRGAPILQNEELHRDFGFLVDTESTLQVLQGTYEYLESTDKFMKVLLQEAQEIYSKCLKARCQTLCQERSFNVTGNT